MRDERFAVLRGTCRKSIRSNAHERGGRSRDPKGRRRAIARRPTLDRWHTQSVQGGRGMNALREAMVDVPSQLRARLAQSRAIVEATSRFGRDMRLAWCVGKQEIAHLHSSEIIDIR